MLRIRHTPIGPALVALVAALTAWGAANEPIIYLFDGQRREILPTVKGEAELLPLEALIGGLDIGLTSDATGGAVTLTYRGREASLYNKKSLASVAGDLRLLSSPTILEGNRWLVPVDAVTRVIGPLTGKHGDWRPASRVLLLGNVSIPKVSLNTFASGDVVRVVFEASEKVPFKVLQEEGRVTVSVSRDVLDVGFQQERLTGGIVDLIQYLGGKDNVFAVTLGRRFQQLKAYEHDGPSRLVLEFQASETPRAAQVPPSAAPPARPAAEPSGVKTVVIDPGHGGEEVGAKGPAGALEKDVTLAIARKLRAYLANSLGYQVFLTRDKDEEVSLDDRVAIANNYKADLFVSIHANASRSRGASGSEVYFLSYQASDEESRRVAAVEGGSLPDGVLPAGTAAPRGSDLALILWNMSQAEHLEESSALASRIQEELSGLSGSQTRGVKQAPFRVLVGATMPAVLVEVAFISHPEEEKLLVSDAYQSKVAVALERGISRFETEHASSAAGPVPAPRP
ncbi:MAG TPA: N-acetylmuramoyl-L-alanine amidase [Vicinamibacteria bacterium]|nr:N-acetylmuramoyl-L-alanine amidase [Vicinamibacteria bacterium]